MASSQSQLVPQQPPAGRRRERFLFSSSDDNAMIKQIEATNAPDDRDFTVKPLLEIVEDIFHRSTPAAPGVALVYISIHTLTHTCDCSVHMHCFLQQT